MKTRRCPHAKTPTNQQTATAVPVAHSFWRRWILANSLLSGCLALGWLLLRSGTKPNRLTYPCQQAAFSTASLAFGVPLVASLIAARRQLVTRLRTRAGLIVAALGLFVTLGVSGYLMQADAYEGPLPEPPREYRAQLYHTIDCPQDPVGEHFVGLDKLLALMGGGGLKFYQSPTPALLAGPDGIIAPDDVVLIKINYQWPERGGSNTDVLRGLIRAIVDHPDGFAGEIVVCENSQFNSIDGFDRTYNNAQNTSLSPHDVVVGFQSQGFRVSHYSWTDIRYSSVTEYSNGNMTDGYVVGPYDSALHGRISYPKFRTDDGTYISLKYGIWDALGSGYDQEHLKFINLPVLKSHHATYGATACVKHYMGVVTRELSTSSHSAIGWGLLGAVIGQVRPADLHILDSIWINANPNSGPATSYGGATRRDQLIASTDPVATDRWAVQNILIPAFLANGYSPPWPYPSADPDDPDSEFRVYLDRSMNYILAAGYDATNKPDKIDTYTWNGVAGDFDLDGVVTPADFPYAADCLSGPGTWPTPTEPATGDECLWGADFDGDTDFDLVNLAQFQTLVN
ncbi:MAG: DUF362 domain-containing protein [Planctomycetota bacterium]